MQKSNYPFLPDWFAISLRWLTLLSFACAMGITRTFNWTLVGILIFSLIWNVLNSVSTILNRRIRHHRLINVLVDGLISILLFIFTRGFPGPLALSSILVIFSGAVYFNILGSIMAAVGISLLQSIYTLFFSGMLVPFWMPGVFLVINLLIAVIVGLLSQQAVHWLRLLYRKSIQRNDEELEIEPQAILTGALSIHELYDVIQAISGTLQYSSVLEITLAKCHEILGKDNDNAERLVSAVMLFDEGKLAIAAGRRIPPRDMKIQFKAKDGLLSETLQHGLTQFTDEPAHDPELSEMVIIQDCQSALCLPLSRGINSFGVILFAHPDQDFFTENHQEILEMLSTQAVIAIQNARLYEDLKLEKERIIASQEEARKQLARELHDGPTQSISAIAMRANIAQKLMEQDEAEALLEIGRIESLARKTTEEIRHMLFTLRPLALESEGLVAALSSMATKMKDFFQQSVESDINNNVLFHLDSAKQSVIFSISEEAANNARKHAQASLIRVILDLHPDDAGIAVLNIQDNGQGFDVQSVMQSYEERGSLGMINLKERTELLNGVLDIKSKPGKGTQIIVYIPLDNQAEERLQNIETYI
ncbi:MAG: GAF domain-containing sensor histidine kinase [Anaerolineaceae bacterium]|nr:GAF domain-containing sensor histidine kinase [Anaerolineaceae bacterium]